MKAVVQRVSSCTVRVDGSEFSRIQKGLLVYLGVSRDDLENDTEYMVKKICNLRIFEDTDGKMNRSLLDTESPEMMVVSQFTLYGDVRKGRRPSFSEAAPPDKGESYYLDFISRVKDLQIHVGHGVFGRRMDVQYTNNGPVTIIIDSSIQTKK